MKKLSFAEIRRLQVDQIQFMSELGREFAGLAHIKALWLEMFVISRPELIRALLVKHGDQLHRDPFVANVFSRFAGQGVFTAEGEAWKLQRKMLTPAFHARRIREYTDVMAIYTRDMVRGWPDDAVVDIGAELVQLTLRIIAKTMYGVDLADQVASLGETMAALLQVAEKQLDAAWLPPAWLPTPMNRRQAGNLRQIHDLLREIIAERRASGRDHGDMLSLLLDMRDEAGQPLTEKQILDECVTLFVAGHETTAAALTWSWYLLTRHAEILADLQAEVAAVLGDQPLRFEHLAQMPLLEAAVKETLRLYPPAPSIGRHVVEPFTIDDIDFPKKAILLIDIYATHHRADLFPEPEQFRPERFLDPDDQPDRYAYLPFGAGARVCLGNMFAMLEARVILATMLQHVDLTATSTAPAVLDTVITLRPRDPIMLHVTRPTPTKHP